MTNSHYEMKLVILIAIAITGMMIVGTLSTTRQIVDAKKKFCSNFSNTDGSISEGCFFKSQGECKKDTGVENEGPDQCHKKGKPNPNPNAIPEP